MATKIKNKNLDRDAILTKVADQLLALFQKKELNYKEVLYVTNKSKKMAQERATVKWYGNDVYKIYSPTS